MTGLHNLKRAKVLRTLERMGWYVAREGANHTVLRSQQCPGVSVPIPRHSVLASGTLRAVLKQTGVSPDEFLQAYNSL